MTEASPPPLDLPRQDRHLLTPLRRGIIVLYTVTVVLIVATLVWISVRDYRATIADAARQSTSLARSLAEHASRSLVSVEQAMQNLAEDIQRAGGIERLDERWVHQRLKEKVVLTPHIRAVIVIDQEGLLAAHGLEYPTRRVNLADREYFLYHRDQTDVLPRLGDPLISRTDGKWLIPLTRRLQLRDGSFGGLLLSGVEPVYFTRFYDSLQIRPGTRITLMRPDGTVVHNHPFDPAALAKAVTILPQPARVPQFLRQRTATEGDRFVVDLKADDAIPLVVRVSTSADQVLRAYKLDTASRIGVAALLLLVLTLMLRLLLRQIKHVQKAEAHLRLTQYTVDESPDMILWCDRNGALRYTNAALAKHSGYSASELQHMRFSDLFSGREMRWERILGLVQQHGRVVAEPHLMQADGGQVPVELTLTRMEFNADSLLCVSVRDITARRRADEELRHHRDNLQAMVDERTAEVRTMLDASPLAVCLSLRNSLLVVNPAFKSLFGYDEVDIVGRHESLLYRSETAYRDARREMKSILLRGDTFRSEIELCRKDGTTFWADLFARALVPDSPGRGVILIIDDITARRTAEQALRRSEQVRRAVLDATLDGFALIDEQRRFIEVNPALSRHLQRNREELIGIRIDAALGDELANSLFPALDETDTQDAAPRELALDVNGNNRQFLVHGSRLAGERAYRFAFLTDISQQKSTEHNLLEAKEAAEAASQAKTSFLTNMSHELRTPMHAILSFSQIGREKAQTLDAQDLVRNYQRIHQSGQRLLRLINALLDMSQLEARRMSYLRGEHALRTTVDNALAELHSVITEKSLHVSIEQNEHELRCTYDDGRITQVLINLLSNAIKYSPPGALLEVRLIHDAQLADGTAAYGVSVRDQGPGIPEEDLERIFETFVQVEQVPLPGSTGLGLSISRHIVQDHHGQLYAHNHAQGGAIFTLLLPVADPLAATA